MMFTNQYPLPYVAVIFSSQRTTQDEEGYQKMAEKMEKLASVQPGFLGIESVRNAEGCGITVSYWSTLEDVKQWKSHPAHQKAQDMGKAIWYSAYETKICSVKHQY